MVDLSLSGYDGGYASKLSHVDKRQCISLGCGSDTVRLFLLCPIAYKGDIIFVAEYKKVKTVKWCLKTLAIMVDMHLEWLWKTSNELNEWNELAEKNQDPGKLQSFGSSIWQFWSSYNRSQDL